MKIIDGMVVVVDTETTDRDPANARVVAVGFAIFDDGHLVERRTIVVNPGEAGISQSDTSGASEVHRLGPDALRAAPRFVVVAPQITNYLNHAAAWGYVCAYNGEFDATVLGAEFARAGEPNPLARTSLIDPRWFVWAQDPVRSSRLSAACAAYGVPHDGAHDAAHDACATGNLLFTLNRMRIIPSDVDLLFRIQRQHMQRHQRSRALFGSYAVFNESGTVQLLKGPRPGMLLGDVDTYYLNQLLADDRAPQPLLDTVRAEIARRAPPG